MYARHLICHARPNVKSLVVFVWRAYSFSGNNRYVLGILGAFVPGLVYTEVTAFLSQLRTSELFAFRDTACLRNLHDEWDGQRKLGVRTLI
jgi:hypothetical protein